MGLMDTVGLRWEGFELTSTPALTQHGLHLPRSLSSVSVLLELKELFLPSSTNEHHLFIPFMP